ncbi:hypothetical protein NDN08_006885 [Rhodosorus marinus]|uniref:MICOS complex subunit MIC10 n=1 Tax=Rhodosorus marinus TaxID=101924 RepID=A0AAV8UIY3_9RHOD|nr:hypothetical protein NDN08_006885 [Rhodosorus marinus]
MGESDFKISRLLDESLETTLKSVGYGFCIGTGIAAVLFRGKLTRSAVLGCATGFALGLSYANLQHDIDEIRGESGS